MLFLFFAVAFALAPLHTVKRPIDRDGLRQYMVLLSDNAPRFGHSLQKLRDWVDQDFRAVYSKNISEIWSIGESFSGFPVWLSTDGVEELRQHNYVKLIEEAQIRTIDPMETDTKRVTTNSTLGDPFTTRVDWGQMRAQGPTSYLQTTPLDLYSGATLYTDGYPSSSLPTYSGDPTDGTWSWNGPVFTTPNTGAGAFVWVIDTGINSQHQEFMRNGASRVTISVDCSGDSIPDDGSYCPPSVVPNGDLNGHGSHCGGICCGNYRGMAPDAGIGSIRIFDDATSGNSVWTTRGLDYAANHKVAGKYNIASMSVGGAKSEVENAALDAIVTNFRMLVVVAAGNEATDSCQSSPASASLAITVGATDAVDTRAGFSNFGACTLIMAPGVQIHSSWKADTTTSPATINVYNTIDGTSMATPNVAGSLALYVTRSPNASPNAARTALVTYGVQGIVQDIQSPNNNFICARFNSECLAQGIHSPWDNLVDEQ